MKRPSLLSTRATVRSAESQSNTTCPLDKNSYCIQIALCLRPRWNGFAYRPYAAFVVGKSSLGRRGIIIETAAGIHPGFCGCLTLEIANIGEIPVKLVSGMMIGQLFVHRVDGPLAETHTALAGQRKPRLGEMRKDGILEKLKKTTF
jgi:hypothetical protein